MENTSWLQFFRTALGGEPSMHPLDHRIAKRYIIQRLRDVYPQLQGKPRALEEAYQSLNLQPRAGQSAEEAATVFEVTLPPGLE